MSSPEKQTSALSIALAWTLVTVPLAWGVYQSVVKSLPLFQSSAAANPPTASVPK